MLQLVQIKKSYVVAGQPFPALNGIDLEFKNNEFVSILGQSGSGKTTMLNLIGGLDRYTSGDLLIDGKSTKAFKDQDWDAYRNATIGFVFQSYNLIGHLSVLDNVEMSLRLSGIGPKERKERATEVLVEVGLKDHIHKRPNQLSGGQMQRVAIARALVNNPKILLADEPTGALDSKTSVQIMQLIQKISKDRLVIMVTHNAEIAEQFSDRIVRLVDGKVVEDTRPVHPQDLNGSEKLINKKTSMSYLTAIKTSFKNLLTKKGRTILTSIAGSIGIVGIALVLSISNGMTAYTDNLQSDALAGFPITISSVVETDSFGPPPGTPFGDPIENEFPDGDTLYAYDSDASTSVHINTIDQTFIDYLEQMDESYYNSISYTRSIALNIVDQTDQGNYVKVTTQSTGGFFGSTNYFSELPDNEEFILSQYDVLAGSYPSTSQELVLVVDSQNRLDLNLLNALGISVDETYQFSDFIGKTFKVVQNNDYYTQIGSIFVPSMDYEAMYTSNQSLALTITGILRVKEDASSELLDEGIGYTTMLTDQLLQIAKTSDIVVAQTASEDINVLTGQPFNAQLTFQQVMRIIGGDDSPTGVQIYPKSFEDKDLIKSYLDGFNVNKTEEESIIYTDLAEQISSTISSLINTITIILAAFAGISLVVSSVMIGIITYVSVVERTKEIGIMRSLGARKKDISRIFNAETLLIGLASGFFGVVVAQLLNFPINIIIENFIDVPNFSNLMLSHAVLLVVLSTILTLIAGLIPSGIAARRDPVIALRTEW
ncbi:MAG TPA: ATP-binding cassette domain-containing protein [Acholeplasmataceae bacterium]|nr:ATP-binding cassette domain-containing protein [Acholeplasmataceae bacterium]